MTYKKQIVAIAFLVSFGLFHSCKTSSTQSVENAQTASKTGAPASILVFSKTGGFRHASIGKGIEVLKKMGGLQHWKMNFSEEASLFTKEELSKYNLILFLNTTGDILNPDEQTAFENYIKSGGNYVGVHAASDTEFDWPFYAEMVGAQFKSHPKQQNATLNKVPNCQHSSVEHYKATFDKFDEWYNFRKPVPSYVNVLLSIDETSYQGDRMGTYHPISWYHVYQGGRVFYTAMGHDDASYSNADFLKHLQEGILWALGQTKEKIDEKGEDLLGADLSKWTPWMGAVHPSVDIDFEKSADVKTGKPMGLDNDTKKVFSIIQENGENVLRVSGEIYGGLTTKKEYGNYHFTTQFKWGNKKWEPRLKDKSDSGILYHAKGPHGAFWNVWMASAEFQVQEGDCGDFYALGDVYGDVPSDKTILTNGKSKYTYNPKGKNVPVKFAAKSGLFEKPNEEWNTLEIYCLDDESIHVVNGHVVNRVKNIRYDANNKTIPVTEGKIQIQSEGAEVFYKKMKIEPITQFPSQYKKS
ncbi:Type 1 glutamine amidotransferase (GATase1) [Flavobacterium fluvii]|uniref:Type 1 glutamine amidotransferase (GATase1) n=1 Tax=Flavobacterium fluvii TaxID=468056 RepID=A0A1M5LMH1_9FLAO|nr:ThuA domain-containing protein [Flavobacterium fluvii]SHG66342.1 Type 1 glutamine amidotransferase (GATase1) [Flavobacterium fluvii]